MKNFSDLTEQELLALAITLEEEDSRIYDQFAEGLRENYPDTAKMFGAMADEESGYRHRLLDLFRAKFGDHIPLIRRQDVKGFVERKPVWLSRPLGLDKVRDQAELMEAETKRFYTRAARRSQDATIRQLLGDLAAEERRHEAKAERLETTYVPAAVREKEHEAERRLYSCDVRGARLARFAPQRRRQRRDQVGDGRLSLHLSHSFSSGVFTRRHRVGFRRRFPHPGTGNSLRGSDPSVKRAHAGGDRPPGRIAQHWACGRQR